MAKKPLACSFNYIFNATSDMTYLREVSGNVMIYTIDKCMIKA